MSNLIQLRMPAQVSPLDRTATAARNAQAFRHGDRRRRQEAAHGLEQLAGEIRRGEANALVIEMAGRLLALRGVR